VALPAALALAIAGCSASQPTPTVPSLHGQSAGPQNQAEALHLAGQCIRQHGIPGFPDPTLDATGQVTVSKTQLIAAPRSTMMQAMTACRSAFERAGIMTGNARNPGGEALTPQQLRHLLAFTRCMRDHGLPGMADPNPVNGQVILPPGVSKDSPVLRRAMQACRSNLPGSGG
jgi:hypothetical protein